MSGGADHTLRLWDLGQQRCLQAFAVHTDSVWALAAPPDLGLVFSGGRDRCVYRRAPRARASRARRCACAAAWLPGAAWLGPRRSSRPLWSQAVGWIWMQSQFPAWWHQEM